MYYDTHLSKLHENGHSYQGNIYTIVEFNTFFEHKIEQCCIPGLKALYCRIKITYSCENYNGLHKIIMVYISPEG